MRAERTRRRIAFPEAELPTGSRKVVLAGRREIVVFNTGEALYAVFNRCPHQQAPLDAGPLGGTQLPSAVGEHCFGMQDQVLRCPWHHYEFDLRSGRSLADPDRLRIATYEVRHEDGEIAVYV